MAITATQIKELREATGVGFLDCRKALEEANGDFDKAVDLLRERGLAKAAKRAGREASEGVLDLYDHVARLGQRLAGLFRVAHVRQELTEGKQTHQHGQEGEALSEGV